MLKDLLDRTLGYLPRYFESVGVILSRPISEVSTRAVEPAFLKDALAFWLISQALVTATRFIAYNADADQVPYFAANFIVSGVTLAVYSAALFWTWHLFAPSLRFGPVTAAVAYLWGALSPIAAVAHVLATGIMRLISPVAFDAFTRALMGCTSARMLASVEESLSQGGVFSALFGTYALIVTAETILFLVYFVCFIRILARLSGLTGARFWIATVATAAVLTVAFGIGAFFHQSLMQGLGHCS